MNQDTKQRAKKPGARIITAGVVVFVYGLVILLINLTAPVDTPERGVTGSLVAMVVGLALAAFGFRKRALAAEK
ncbi:hypothetical protein PP639_gp019 [Arthrobacter phage Seahorse]|uniref:Uncharacterized protein n=1 Tax=Arthrobacter phage Seahorse TaxID=2419611 RepID=A0A3G3M5E7_9CAUD|nr:hypothetical protein PP639_gp019 [Arthrobacter phage Seahorse]AYR01601.1 hypothetical protein PBI_SEAHORSE_19 [Arthrobacter phage Seahorse]